MTGAKVLVVDDDAFAVRVLTRALEEAGSRTIAATDLATGRKHVDADMLDAAVIDLKLADEHGGALILALRAKRYPTSALLITGARSLEAAREGIATGAEEVLLKPFDNQSFLGAVSRTIVRTRAWRESLHAAAWGDQRRCAGGDRSTGRRRAAKAQEAAPAMDVEQAADRIAQAGDLSDRERTIVVYLLRGLRTIEIAPNLGLTERTVKFHLSNLYKKLGIAGRADLTRFLF